MGRRRPSIGVVLVVAMLGAGLLDAAAAEPPRVRLITTGGTISNRPGDRLSPGELVALIPDLDQVVAAETEEFANVPSSALTLDQWLRLGRRVNQVLAADPELAGVVVTSGTDTLEELAFFLHLTVRDQRPVVVVGAMRRPGTAGYDGAANLRQAFRVAGEPASRGRGVLVVLSHEINSAREVTKTDTLGLQSFDSPGAGVLGIVARDEVVYYRAVERRHTSETEFDLGAVARLPRVDIVMSYQGATGDLIRAAVDRGAAGLVVAAAGAGATSSAQRDAIAYAHERGTVVVIASRTGGGRVTPLPTEPEDGPEEPLPRQLTIAGDDLAPLKARILLMLGLTVSTERETLQRMFTEY